MKTRFIFTLWLTLYKLESSLWEQYSKAFMKLNKGKDFPQYHQYQYLDDEIHF